MRVFKNVSAPPVLKRRQGRAHTNENFQGEAVEAVRFHILIR